MQRRLATILVADVVGYSRLMEAAEETTAARLQTCHQLMSKSVAAADGRVFERAGDAMLAEFASPINALHCAVQIRESMVGGGRPINSPVAIAVWIASRRRNDHW